jgi:hypothetical protein
VPNQLQLCQLFFPLDRDKGEGVVALVPPATPSPPKSLRREDQTCRRRSNSRVPEIRVGWRIEAPRSGTHIVI